MWGKRLLFRWALLFFRLFVREMLLLLTLECVMQENVGVVCWGSVREASVSGINAARLVVKCHRGTRATASWKYMIPARVRYSVCIDRVSELCMHF